MMRRVLTLWAALVLGVLLAIAPAAAIVPSSVDFQGLLLDTNGDPVNGQVDLVFTLFDALTDGSSLWTETHTDVDVVDGVYDVELGSLTPLTQSVLDGGGVFLEVQVDGETLTPRQQLLAVPYALRAAQADDASNVGGLSSVFVTQIFENVSFDGGDPPNDDPSEGLGDTDGDGLANFIDPDNDDDGIADPTELGQGSDINLPTPVISGFDPEPVEAGLVSIIEVQGANFVPGISVVFGSEMPTPSNITATSFDVQIGPQTTDTASVTVTRPNGEFATSSFDFSRAQPVIENISPLAAFATDTTLVTISGQNFLPGTTVSFGSENPVPQNLTSTSFDVQVGPQPVGTVGVTVTSPNGLGDSASFRFRDALIVFATSTFSNGVHGGLVGADGTCNNDAAVAGILGTFVAWLSTASVDAGDRIGQAPGVHYELPGGTVVADDFADLTDGTLDAPIDETATGASLPSVFRAWTGTGSDGLASADRCQEWTSLSAGVNGTVGDAQSTTSTWSDDGSLACNENARLYCFEQ